MKTLSSSLLSVCATAMALLPLTGTAQAQQPAQGSNVMDGIMDRLMHPSAYGLAQGTWQDGVCGDFNYAPIGSIEAQRTMCNNRQSVALMTHPLLPSSICEEGCGGALGKAAQTTVGGNSITLLRNNGAADNKCDTKIGGENWAQVIRTLYAGADGSGSFEACSAPERQELVNNWANLWSDSCDSPSPCTQVHHLFRPDENSGMGKAFAARLGIQNYCNGGNQEDNDPIRRPCEWDEYYCPNAEGGLKGDLGVVLPIKLPVPEEIPKDYFESINNTKLCPLSSFDFGFAYDSSKTNCPDGTDLFFGYLCLYPSDEDANFGCINRYESGSGFNFLLDGRTYNEVPRSRTGRPVYPAGSQVGDWREFYRIHAGCKDGGRDNSELLGCIVRQSQCSIGWGSMIIQKEAKEHPEVAIADLDGQPINELGYPLNHALYFSTINGFDSATGEEAKLVECVRSHPGRVAAAVKDAGFIPAFIEEHSVKCSEGAPR